MKEQEERGKRERERRKGQREERKEGRDRQTIKEHKHRVGHFQ